MNSHMVHLVLRASSYRLSLYALPVAATFIAILSVGFYVLIREKHSSVKTSFFLMTLPAAIWLATFAMMYSSTSYDVARFWSKAGYLGVPFIPTSIYYF